MNLIFTSEERKSVLGEVVKLDSPTLVIVPRSNHEFVSSSPLKVIGYKSFNLLKGNLEDYEVFIIDPEFIYPLSPLYRERYGELYRFVKTSKFKNISTISGCISKKNLRRFLSKLNSPSDMKIEIRENYDYEVAVFFTDKKFSFINSILHNQQLKRTLVVSKDIPQSFVIKNLLEDIGISCLILKDNDFDARRIVLSKFKVYSGVLVVPYRFRFLVKNIRFSNVVYVRIPRTLPEFIYDTLNIHSDNYTIIVSPKDEDTIAKKMDKSLRLRDEYLEWLNFLGFSGDRREYLSAYLRSEYVKQIKINAEIQDENKRIVYEAFKGRYVEFEDGIKSLMGVNDRFLWRHFGALRGIGRNTLISIVNSLINKGFLGFRYFYRDGVVKKVY